MGVEVLAREGPAFVLVVDEPLLVLPKQHVRVNERPSAEPARDDCPEIPERPDVEHPVAALLRDPEVAIQLVGCAREGIWWITSPAFQNDDLFSLLGEAI